ncbi:MAG TPA: secondary thiamine-phosphate synthase enzyme YjbQ [Chloroflexota bacterium]
MTVAIAPPSGGFLVSSISVKTLHACQFVDLTESVIERVTSAGVRNGVAVVASQHTTASIVVNEHEPELLKDLEDMLRRLAPESSSYSHNSVPCAPDEVPNGHAHCQGLLLNASASIPIADGRLALGRYQRIFLVELDHARPRQVSVMVLGTSG